MKVAAVQLNSSAERQANIAAADRLVRAAAADGARLVVLPEKWTAIGSNEQMLRRGGAARRARRSHGRERSPRSSAIELVAGSILERLEGGDARGQHVRARRSRGRRAGELPQDPHVRRGGGRTHLPRVGDRGGG